MVKIPKKAVEAAAKAIADEIGHGMSEKCFDHARDALTAAAPHMSGVNVKQLEWGELRHTSDYKFAQDAKTSIGNYVVTDSGWFLQAQSNWCDADSLEDAKAAAQAEFEKRILSAIEPSSARELPPGSALIREYVEDYEWLTDGGDYTPNNTERAMIEDAIAGYEGYVDEALASSAREQALEVSAEDLYRFVLEWERHREFLNVSPNIKSDFIRASAASLTLKSQPAPQTGGGE